MYSKSGMDNYDLLINLKEGNAAAFTELYHIYGKGLYRNILRFVKCEETAKELLQDAFLKIWNHRQQIDPEKSFKSFLFKITEHLIFDYFRKVSRDRKLMEKLIAVSTEYYTHSEESVFYKESLHMINQVIDKLPPQRKQVFKLCKMEGKSYEEVSQLLGISTSTISDHIVKANRVVKEYLHLNKDMAIMLAVMVFLQNL